MSSSAIGYLTPTTAALPGGLTLEQYIQQVLVGISGIAGTLVRPSWQIAPPKQPEITVDWMAFAIQIDQSPGYAYVSGSNDLTSYLARQETLSIQVSMYGPNCFAKIAEVRDGFQIQQNLDALRDANMGFQECSQIIRVPDMINGRWVNRCDMTLVLVRRVVRTYEILSIAKAEGTIHTEIDGQPYSQTWQTPDLEA